MSQFLKPRYQAMEAYVPGEQPRDKAYIKLNTHESPYPPAPSVAAALTQQRVDDLRLYSDPTGKKLKEKLAELYGVQLENIFLSNGSDEILNFVFMAFPGKAGAVFPDITYGFYSVFAELHGVPYRQIPLREDFSLNPEDYLGAETVVIANPNAPTGLSISVSDIEKILAADPDRVVVIDEAYVDFGGESCYPLIEKYENLLVVRTFSKSRCLAGGRLGYAIGSAGLIADLEKIKYSTNPYNVNALTLALGEATVDAEDYYQEKCAEIIRVRQWTKQQLESVGFRVLPSQTNFLFAASEKISGGELYVQLKKRGILVRYFHAPRTKDFVRITIGTQKQMEAFMKAVNTVLSGE